MELVEIIKSVFNNPWFIGFALGFLFLFLGLKFSGKQKIYNITFFPIIRNVSPQELAKRTSNVPEQFKKIQQGFGTKGSIALKMKGIAPTGRVVDIIPLIKQDENQLRLYIGDDKKMKFYIKTSEIKHTLEVSDLPSVFNPTRWHIVLLQWSKNFIAINLDGQVVAQLRS